MRGRLSELSSTTVLAGEDAYDLVINSIADVKSDYGILPRPKTCNGIETVSHVMEVIRKAAYEPLVKAKSLRIPETEEVLDLIYSSIYVDPNDIFNLGGTTGLLDSSPTKGSGTFAA